MSYRPIPFWIAKWRIRMTPSSYCKAQTYVFVGGLRRVRLPGYEPMRYGGAEDIQKRATRFVPQFRGEERPVADDEVFKTTRARPRELFVVLETAPFELGVEIVCKIELKEVVALADGYKLTLFSL